MWCDNFDLDLRAIVPEAIAAIEPVRDIVLYTTGKVSDGKLNHPTVWNGAPGLMAFFCLTADRRSLVPEGYVVDHNAQTVACTFEEAVRDCWLHHYAMILRYCAPGLGKWYNSLLWNSGENRRDFEILMWATRRWREIEERELRQARQAVALSLKHATLQLLDVLDICQRGAHGDAAGG